MTASRQIGRNKLDAQAREFSRILSRLHVAIGQKSKEKIDKLYDELELIDTTYVLDGEMVKYELLIRRANEVMRIL